MKIRHKAIVEVEDAFCEDGRFFVHLKEGYDWNVDPFEIRRSMTFGTEKEARLALKKVKKVP